MVARGVAPQLGVALGPWAVYKKAHVVVSNPWGYPSWMVDFMEIPIQIDDLGVPPCGGFRNHFVSELSTFRNGGFSSINQRHPAIGVAPF